MQRGPVDVVFVTFPDGDHPQAALGALRTAVGAGAVGVVDLVLFLREADGSLRRVDAEDPETPIAALAGVTLDPHRLLNDEDLDALADAVPEGHSAAAVVLENLWARGLAGELAAAEAELALFVRIPAEAVDAALAAETVDA